MLPALASWNTGDASGTTRATLSVDSGPEDLLSVNEVMRARFTNNHGKWYVKRAVICRRLFLHHRRLQARLLTGSPV
jgi:hypothetical protein